MGWVQAVLWVGDRVGGFVGRGNGRSGCLRTFAGLQPKCPEFQVQYAVPNPPLAEPRSWL